MSKKIIKILLYPYVSLLLIFTSVLSLHLTYEDNISEYLIPESVYKFNLAIMFETEGDVEISTYLPLESTRQEILDETMVAKSLEIDDKNTNHGRYVKWRGGKQSQKINYSNLLSMRSIKYNIAHNLEIPSYYEKEYHSYLQETDVIPVRNEEIIQLWNKIKPENEENVYQVLSKIYSYTYNTIKSLPFKGLTDSLTALRLGAASCNGKSRLFLSLARLNNLPSRLVGGVIMNGKKKKTSHQWVEVYIEEHWVPFDVLNGHFASLPEYYLELYRGDKQLFKHTSDINFNYYFNSSSENLAPALYRNVEENSRLFPNASQLLQELGLPLKASFIFLLFPLCTLVISFLRNIIGIKTFGTFMPMLIAAACVYTGYWYGMLGFTFVLIFAFIGHAILGKLHVLKIPRLAAIITLISIMLLLGMMNINIQMEKEFGMLALFPAVIISFTADRIQQMSSENNWFEIFLYSLGTLLTISICYLTFNSILLQGLFSLYPELLLLILAILLYIGSWSGIRVSEVIRFKALLNKCNSKVLSINSRNRNFIYKHNDKRLLKLATDKLETKQALEEQKIPCPPTLGECRNHADINQFLQVIETCQDMVIKPNKGSRGNGILILNKGINNKFQSRSGKPYPLKEIKKHIGEILSGCYSQDGNEDEAYIEPVIQQHPVLTSIAPLGLCDIRIIVCNGSLISSMLRVPTSKSDGKANLHQGAVGVSINIQSGKIERAVINGRKIDQHPDLDINFKDLKIPFWNEIKDIALKCYVAIPLGYMGVDICIDADHGPVVLEVNGRPGLEIQNVQNTGMEELVNEAF